jgi:hypothetical protein
MEHIPQLFGQGEEEQEEVKMEHNEVPTRPPSPNGRGHFFLCVKLIQGI